MYKREERSAKGGEGRLEGKGSWGQWGLRDWWGQNGKERACQGAMGERAKPGRQQFHAGVLRQLLSPLMRDWGTSGGGGVPRRLAC